MSEFLETVRTEFNRMRGLAFAGDYEGVTHAGIALVALDTGRVFLAKRAFDPTDAPDVAETWEFPSGSLQSGASASSRGDMPVASAEVPLSIAFTATDEASTVSAVDNRGVGGVEMPSGTPVLATVDGRRAETDQNILLKGGRLKVAQAQTQSVQARGHTSNSVTSVVDDPTVRDGSVDGEVKPTVEVSGFTIQPSLGVSASTSGSGPKPVDAVGVDTFANTSGKQGERVEVIHAASLPPGTPQEDPWTAARREFVEEIGLALPDDALVTAGWRAPNGVYQGFVVTTMEEFPVDGWSPTTEVADIGWFDHDAVMALQDAKALRPEMSTMDWSLVFPETAEEDHMTQMTDEGLDYSSADFMPDHIMVHGVLAPEAAPSGDQRGFTDGAVTARPLRLAIGWQEVTAPQHNNAVTVGGLDRMMRKDGLIHFEGALMSSVKADEFTDLLCFFGQYGLSIDGVNGSIDMEKSQAEGMVWFDAVKVAGAVACSVPAFQQAYIALGPHPDMPVDNTPEAMTASGLDSTDMIGARMEFARGPGWVTDPKATNRIHDYWTKPGEPGFVKVGWDTPGAFARAKALIGEKIAKHSPDKMRFLNQIIAQWYHDATGRWPGTAQQRAIHAKGPLKASAMDSAMDDEDGLYFRDVPTEERKRLAGEGKAMPDGSFPIANEQDLRNAIQAIGRAKDPAKAKAHIKKRAAALGKTDLIPDTWAAGSLEVGEELFDEADKAGRITEVGIRDDGAILYELDNGADGWEAVLVSSAGQRILPPRSYFDRQENTENCIIEEPDENGFRQTYGYAAEWGVCHIGKNGVCVEPPEPDDDGYPAFHLGRTKTTEGYIKTGLITYGVAHRGADEILSQTATQAHFDDLSHAWAQVRCGHDDRGIWFAGVVLPTVEEKWITAIEASGQVSGEWLHGAMRTLLTVNVPGFPVIESSAVLDDDGNVLALAASAFQNVLTASVNHIEESECARADAADRMEALRVIDAEIRFAALREQFLAERG